METMTNEDRVQVVYDAMHDRTCFDHGPHCREVEAPLKDAIAVGLRALAAAEGHPQQARTLAIYELERLADLLWDDKGPAPQYIASRIEELKGQ